MRKVKPTVLLLASLFIALVLPVPLGAASSAPASMDIVIGALDPRPFDQLFYGVKLGEDGHLIPSAWGAVETFEKDADAPENNIFVSPDGDDGLDGMTPVTAYRTVQKAVDEATPGTAVWLMPGEYPRDAATGGISIGGKVGTAKKPIWIGGLPGQPLPKLTATNAVVSGGEAKYVVLHDIEIDNEWGFTGDVAPHAVHISTPNKTLPYGEAEVCNVVLRGLRIHGYCNSGVKIDADYIWIFDCEIYDQSPNDTPNPNGTGGVIRAAASVDAVASGYLTYAYNYIHDYSSTALSVKGGSIDCKMYGNLIARGGIGLQLGQTTGLQFFRPSVDDNPGVLSEAENCSAFSNILIDVHTPFDVGSSKNSVAVNNTVFIMTPYMQRKAVTFSRWFRISNTNNVPELYLSGTPVDGTIANNLFYVVPETLETNTFELGLNTPGSKGAIETFTVRQNMFSADPNIADFNTGNKDLFWSMNGDMSKLANQDPLFVNASNDVTAFDYHPGEGSPAEGTGYTGPEVSVAATDYYGMPFRAEGRNIGAVESGHTQPEPANPDDEAQSTPPVDVTHSPTPDDTAQASTSGTETSPGSSGTPKDGQPGVNLLIIIAGIVVALAAGAVLWRVLKKT